MGAVAKLPFSNLQLEILKLYESGVAEEDLLAINQLIVNYFAKKTQDSADKHWDENNFSNELLEEWLNKDIRK